MRNQEIKFKSQGYSIIIGRNVLNVLPKKIKILCPKAKKIALIIDKKVPQKFTKNLKNKLKNYNLSMLSFNASEKNKSIDTINNYLKILLSKNFNRTDLVIGVGGGITGDTVGFVASIYKRGIKFINVPTTLLSQVDSSIGGKTGVNNIFGKNLIGSFYQPELVISDVKILNSLNKREIICGYGELFKHSIISKTSSFNYLNKNKFKILDLKPPFLEKAIYESCKVKKNVVEKDEKEKNLRKILNFGHTFAHAYEATFGYSKKLNHGEAVLLGMNSALRFSNEKKLLSNQEYNLIKNHTHNSNLPYNLKKYFSKNDLKKILTFMSNDKKNNSKKISLILLKKIGNPIIRDYDQSILKRFLIKELVN